MSEFASISAVKADLFGNFGGKTVKNQSSRKAPFFQSSSVKSNRESDHSKKPAKDKLASSNQPGLALNLERINKGQDS